MQTLKNCCPLPKLITSNRFVQLVTKVIALKVELISERKKTSPMKPNKGIKLTMVCKFIFQAYKTFVLKGISLDHSLDLLEDVDEQLSGTLHLIL